MKHIIITILSTVAVILSTPSSHATLLLDQSSDKPYVSASQDAETLVEVNSSSGRIDLKSSASAEVTCYVYSITGQLVSKVKVGAGTTAKVDLCAGCYIVKTPFSTRKVMVK